MTERLTSDPTRLEPDERELFLAAHMALEGCPFCGRQPTLHSHQNPTTHYFVAKLICSECFVQMVCCARERKEAQDHVLARWAIRAHEKGPHHA